jgi:RNA polymerase sigma-70 factor (ECF subfamily)
VTAVSSPASTLIDDLDLDGYYPYHAARADLLHRLNRDAEAATAYQRAAALAPAGPEHDYLSLHSHS